MVPLLPAVYDLATAIDYVDAVFESVATDCTIAWGCGDGVPTRLDPVWSRKLATLYDENLVRGLRVDAGRRPPDPVFMIWKGLRPVRLDLLRTGEVGLLAPLFLLLNGGG